MIMSYRRVNCSITILKREQKKHYVIFHIQNSSYLKLANEMPKLSNVNVILWWVEARFGKTVPVNRVKGAHDHVVPPCELQHPHTEKRTKKAIKCHSHLMGLGSHLSIFKYDEL